jgi:hypothetical protein
MQVSSCVQAYDMEDEMVFQRLVEDYESHAGDTGLRISELSLYARVIFPVVVVGGNLFECCLDRSGEVMLSRVDTSVVLVPSKDPQEVAMIPSHVSAVTIVAQEHIDAFAVEAYHAAMDILAEEKALREVWGFERNKLLPESATDELPF